MKPGQVREELQHKYGLRVLRIYMDNLAQGKPLAVFTLTERDGSVAGLITASLPELGFDLQRREGSYGCLALPSVFKMPPHILAAVSNWLSEDPVGGEALWLRLSVPLGLLAAVPWEELLQSALKVPVLRLPYQSICPRQPSGQSNTVVCFSSPVDEADLQKRIDAFVSQVPQDLACKTHFHLFGDRAMYHALLELKHRYAHTMRITVHDPAGATADNLPLSNPWLRWIAMCMGEGRVDVVHFLCHSQYLPESAALKLACSPGDTRDQPHPCLLHATELIDFFDHVGAWCAAFTSAPAETSAAGMRMLQTEIARRRPGPLLVHDMNVEHSADALASAYRFLFSSNSSPPASPAVSLYCHPILLQQDGVDQESNKQLTEFTLDGRLRDELHDNKLPGWVLSSQRKLEVTAGSLADAQMQDRNSGRVRGRKLVLDAVADYATARRPEVIPGDSDE